MGHKSDYSRHLKELGKGIIETTTITDASLASLMQSESDKVQELIKKNASIDDLLKSSKIFSDMLFNLVLVQLIPILKTTPKNNSPIESITNVLSQDSKNNAPNDIASQTINFSEDDLKDELEPKASTASEMDTSDVSDKSSL